MKRGTSTFWQLAEKAYKKNPPSYHQVILENFGTTPYWQSRTYQHIASIPFRGFITLNYDDQLPMACLETMKDEFARGFTVYPPRPDRGFANAIDFLGDQRQILCAHGYADPQNPNWPKQIILKTSDYDSHYTNPGSNLLFHFWKALLLLSPCLFVGMSLEEPGLLKVVEDLKLNHPDKLRSMQHRHLIRCDKILGTHHYPKPMRSLGEIEQLQFDRIDSRYSGLIRILGAISGIPTESPSPNLPAPMPISATSNFTFFSP